MTPSDLRERDDMTDREKLVEKMAADLAAQPGGRTARWGEIRRLIALVLEEAARVAEAFPAHTHGNLATAPAQAAEQAADEIAAAIRSMKGDANV